MIPVQIDDDVTTSDGHCGIVIGVDGDRVRVLIDAVTVVEVRRWSITTINQQGTWPRKLPFPPPAICDCPVFEGVVLHYDDCILFARPIPRAP